MITNGARTQTPEELELDRKLKELSELETELAQQELDLATLQGQLNTFEAKYVRIVGVLFAELDEIEAQIAELKAKLEPKNIKIQEQAANARTHAQNTAQATGIVHDLRVEKFIPSESLKKLYREVAKCVHPDLAIDENDRAKRQQLMSQANQAYKEGDEEKLLSILEEWKNSPESIKGDDTASELVRVIRKIAQIEKRLIIIETEIPQIKKTDLFQLKIKVELAENEGQNLLKDMAYRVKTKIGSARNRLAEINGVNYKS